MAQKRMFSVDVVESDIFLDLPMTAQSLYFHLCMNADDYGFVQPRKTMRAVGGSADDLRILIMKRYILSFDSGVVAIKHWLISNTIRKDRSKPTTYQLEYKQLTINEWGAYTERRSAQTSLLDTVNSNTTPDSGQNSQNDDSGNHLATQIRLEQNRLDKISTTTNVVAAKKPRSEIGSLYYKVIKAYDLPVTNHNVIQSKIRQWEKESDNQTAINYLNFLLTQYQSLNLKYKPQIATALDIYSKRAMIREAIQGEIIKTNRRKIRKV